MKILSNVDFDSNPSSNLVIASVDTLPTSGNKKGAVYNKGNNLYYFNGSTWINLSKASTKISYELRADSWSDGRYEILDGSISSDSMVYIELGGDCTLEQYEAISQAKIIAVDQSTGKVTIKALGTVPEISISLTIVIE